MGIDALVDLSRTSCDTSDGSPLGQADNVATTAIEAAAKDPHVRETAIEHREYRPLEFPNLHRLFGQTPADEEGILSFATRFGLLGRRVAALHPNPEGPDFQSMLDEFEAGGSGAYRGEALSFWQFHLRQMRVLLRLFDLYRTQEVNALQQLSGFLRIGRNQIEYVGPEREAGILVNVPEDLLAQTNESMRTYRAARAVVWDYVNRELQEGTRPVLGGGSVPLEVRSIDLLGAIYAHFALEIVGLRLMARVCEGCGKLFVPVDKRQKYCPNPDPNQTWQYPTRQGCRKLKQRRKGHPARKS